MALPTIDVIVDTIRWLAIVIYLTVAGAYAYTVDSEIRFTQNMQSTCDYPLEKDTTRSHLYSQAGHLKRMYITTSICALLILITTAISLLQAYLASNADNPLSLGDTIMSMLATAPLKAILILKDRAFILFIAVLVIIMQLRVRSIGEAMDAATACYRPGKEIDTLKGYLPTIIQSKPLDKLISSRLPADGSLNLSTLSPDQVLGYTSFHAASPDVQAIIDGLCGHNICITLPNFELFPDAFLTGLADVISSYTNATSSTTVTELATFFTNLQDTNNALIKQDKAWWTWYLASNQNPVIPTSVPTPSDYSNILVRLLRGVDDYCNDTAVPPVLPASYLIHGLRKLLSTPTSTLIDINNFIAECKAVDPNFTIHCNIVTAGTAQPISMEKQTNYVAFQRKARFSFKSLKSDITAYIAAHHTSPTTPPTPEPPYDDLAQTFNRIQDSDVESWVAWVTLLRQSSPASSAATPTAAEEAHRKSLLIHNTFCQGNACSEKNTNIRKATVLLRDELDTNIAYESLLRKCVWSKVFLAIIVVCVAVLIHRKLNPPLVITVRMLSIILVVAIVVLLANKYTSSL